MHMHVTFLCVDEFACVCADVGVRPCVCECVCLGMFECVFA